MRIFHNEKEITKAIHRIDNEISVFNYIAGEYLYIASDLPFNHLFIKLGAVLNAVSSTMKIEYYGNNWNEVIEIRDYTEALSKDGFVEFTPNRNSKWSRLSSSETIGLTKVIYDKYWMRISFNNSLTATTELSFIGRKFSDDTDLFYEYPVFNDSNFLKAFKVGKTSWEEQHVRASEVITEDLKRRGIIVGTEQILDRNRFTGASICKTAEIIYTAFGNDYVEQKKEAAVEYIKRLDMSQYSIDSNNDAILSPSEITISQGWLVR